MTTPREASVRVARQLLTQWSEQEGCTVVSRYEGDRWDKLVDIIATALDAQIELDAKVVPDNWLHPWREAVMKRWEVLDMEVGKVVHDSYVDGVRVLVMRGPGSLCAYCGVPSKHPLAGRSYDNLTIDCHGGLTFAREGETGSGWPEGFFWYGWDYSHSGDRATYSYNEPLIGKFPLRDGEKEWAVTEVVQEARWVAYQFKRLMTLAEDVASNRRAWQDTIDALTQQLAAKDAEIARLIAANEGWHTRVSQLKADNEAYAEKLEEQDAELARVRGEHEYRVREVGELNIKLRDLQTDLEQAKAQALKYHGGLVNEQLMRSTATQRTERAEAACAELIALGCDCDAMNGYVCAIHSIRYPGQHYLNMAKLVEGLPKAEGRGEIMVQENKGGDCFVVLFDAQSEHGNQIKWSSGLIANRELADALAAILKWRRA